MWIKDVWRQNCLTYLLVLSKSFPCELERGTRIEIKFLEASTVHNLSFYMANMLSGQFKIKLCNFKIFRGFVWVFFFWLFFLICTLFVLNIFKCALLMYIIKWKSIIISRIPHEMRTTNRWECSSEVLNGFGRTLVWCPKTKGLGLVHVFERKKCFFIFDFKH